jgi:peptide/nickel transport system substrate-binding protein
MPQHPSALQRPPGRTRRRQGVGLVLFALAAAVALAALTGTGNARAGTRADTPTRGGELKLLGTSDIFNIDTVSAYYTVSNLLERAWTRQLVSYVNAPTFPGSIKLVPDVAAALPVNGNGISADGKTYTFKIRQGVQWDTTPPRQVTADDFVREFKLLCNPISPVGAPGYFTSTIVGMKAYCDGFAKVKKPTVDGIAAYVSGHKLAGVVATDPSTLTFKLLQPAGDFLNILTMGFASARPVEYDQYLPDSAQLRQHTIADGPYKITSYTATKGFTLERNPAWTQASDPLRHAYVDKITITEGLSSTSVQQQIEAGTGDMEWDIQPPSQDLPRLISAGDKGLILGPTGPYYVAIGYYLALNQYAGVMKKKLVRQAVATAVNKKSIVQILGGPKVNAVSDQIIPPGNVGFVPGFNAYPANTGGGNPAASKALLAKAGYPNGLAIKILSSTSDPGPRVAQAIQSSLNAGGFKVTLVPVTQTDYYGKYLTQPSIAKKGAWDIALPGYIPDWFGNNGRSVVQPLFTNPGLGSTDWGGYDNPTENALVDKALTARTPAQANKLWAAAQTFVMKDAGYVPINVQKWPIYHSARLQGCNFFWYTLSCDVTNVWIK